MTDVSLDDEIDRVCANIEGALIGQSWGACMTALMETLARGLAAAPDDAEFERVLAGALQLIEADARRRRANDDVGTDLPKH